MIWIVAVVVAPIVHAASKHPSLMDKALQWAQIAGGLAALSAVSVFAWAKLRLDRIWGWVFKHLKEDQAATRKKELLDSMQSPELVALRQNDFKEVLGAQIMPQLETMQAAHEGLRRGQASLEKTFMDHISSEDNALAVIGAQQSEIHKRIDDHMVREEEASAEQSEYMKRTTDHICQISTAVEKISTEQERVATALVTSQAKVERVAAELATELERVDQDRPVWLADREALHRYMEKGTEFMEHNDATDPKAV